MGQFGPTGLHRNGSASTEQPCPVTGKSWRTSGQASTSGSRSRQVGPQQSMTTTARTGRPTLSRSTRAWWPVAVALYETGGIRSCEIGTGMFGRQPDGTEVAAAMDLVRPK